MNAFDTVLVPVNGSDYDNRVIPMALDEAFRHNAHLHLLYVVIRPEACAHHVARGGPMPVPDVRFDSETCRECSKAVAYLIQIRQRHHLPDNTEQSIHVGDPIRHIEDVATAQHRTLVVMATGIEVRDGNQNQFRQAEQLLRRGRCQLLLIDRANPAQELYKEETFEHSTSYVGTPL